MWYATRWICVSNMFKIIFKWTCTREFSLKRVSNTGLLVVWYMQRIKYARKTLKYLGMSLVCVTLRYFVREIGLKRFVNIGT